jgi:hypothetical protein
MLTFDNPESTNINVFNSSIDYVNNSNLVNYRLDLLNRQRADSVYIVTTPDYNMYTPDGGSQYEIIYPQEAVGQLRWQLALTHLILQLTILGFWLETL